MKIIEIFPFYNSKYSDKNQVTGKQEFSPKKDSCITLKRPKNTLPHFFYVQCWFPLAFQMKISNTRNLTAKSFDESKIVEE